jgi:hypothetical protein
MPAPPAVHVLVVEDEWSMSTSIGFLQEEPRCLPKRTHVHDNPRTNSQWPNRAGRLRPDQTIPRRSVAAMCSATHVYRATVEQRLLANYHVFA